MSQKLSAFGHVKRLVRRLVLAGPVAVVPYGVNVVWLGIAYYVIHASTLFGFLSVVIVGDVIGYVAYQLMANLLLDYQIRSGYFKEEELQKMLDKVRAKRLQRETETEVGFSEK